MNRYSWLEGYLLSMPGAVTDYKLEWQWQRYLVGGRMFAAVCTPGPEHAAHAGRTMVILKCDHGWPRHFASSTGGSAGLQLISGIGTRSIWTGLSRRRAAGLLRHVL